MFSIFDNSLSKTKIAQSNLEAGLREPCLSPPLKEAILKLGDLPHFEENVLKTISHQDLYTSSNTLKTSKVKICEIFVATDEGPGKVHLILFGLIQRSRNFKGLLRPKQTQKNSFFGNLIQLVAK
jgi:hypothetical protein